MIAGLACGGDKAPSADGPLPSVRLHRLACACGEATAAERHDGRASDLTRTAVGGPEFTHRRPLWCSSQERLDARQNNWMHLTRSATAGWRGPRR